MSIDWNKVASHVSAKSVAIWISVLFYAALLILVLISIILAMIEQYS